MLSAQVNSVPLVTRCPWNTMMLSLCVGSLCLLLRYAMTTHSEGTRTAVTAAGRGGPEQLPGVRNWGYPVLVMTCD